MYMHVYTHRVGQKYVYSCKYMKQLFLYYYVLIIVLFSI